MTRGTNCAVMGQGRHREEVKKMCTKNTEFSSVLCGDLDGQVGEGRWEGGPRGRG